MSKDTGRYAELLAEALAIAPDLSQARALLPVLQLASLEPSAVLTRRLLHAQAEPWALDLVEDLGTTAMLTAPSEPLVLGLSAACIERAVAKGHVDLDQQFDPREYPKLLQSIKSVPLLEEPYGFLAAALSAQRNDYLQMGQVQPLLRLRSWNHDELTQAAAVLLHSDSGRAAMGMELIMKEKLNPFAIVLTKDKFNPTGRLLMSPLRTGALSTGGESFRRFIRYCVDMAATPDERTALVRALGQASTRRGSEHAAAALVEVSEVLQKNEITPQSLLSLVALSHHGSSPEVRNQIKRAVENLLGSAIATPLNWRETVHFLTQYGSTVSINGRKLLEVKKGALRMGRASEGPVRECSGEECAAMLERICQDSVFEDSSQSLVKEFAQVLRGLDSVTAWSEERIKAAQALALCLMTPPPKAGKRARM